MNVKLTKNEVEIVIKAISAYIREEERSQIIAEEFGFSTTPYETRIKELRELKTKFE